MKTKYEYNFALEIQKEGAKIVIKSIERILEKYNDLGIDIKAKKAIKKQLKRLNNLTESWEKIK